MPCLVAIHGRTALFRRETERNGLGGKNWGETAVWMDKEKKREKDREGKGREEENQCVYIKKKKLS